MAVNNIAAAVGLALALAWAPASRAQSGQGDGSSPTAEQLAAAQDLTGRVVWLERPDAYDFARAHESIQRMRGLSVGVDARGDDMRVTLDCLVGSDGRLACAAAHADSAVYIRPTLSLAGKFLASPVTSNGRSAFGGRVRLTFRFER